MKIMLAEDDPSIQSIAMMSLTRVGGHQVFLAKNGQEILDHVQKEKPDVILLDVMMPTLNGFETCTKLKADPHTKNIPIIFLTAKAQSHEIHHGMSLGAMGYILKPFDPMTLHQQVEEILKSHLGAK